MTQMEESLRLARQVAARYLNEHAGGNVTKQDLANKLRSTSGIYFGPDVSAEDIVVSLENHGLIEGIFPRDR